MSVFISDIDTAKIYVQFLDQNTHKLSVQFYLSAELYVNPLLPKIDLYILLCLTPDDFTRQRETSRALKS